MITTESVKETGGTRPPDPTVRVTAVRRFAYPVLVEGKWESVFFDEGDKLDMFARDVQRHIKANLVRRTAGRKKVQVEENK